jgi:hypothetical protein
MGAGPMKVPLRRRGGLDAVLAFGKFEWCATRT